MPDNMRPPIVRLPGEGREYTMPTMHAVFHADGTETGDAYSVSEWRLEPKSDGPGPHSHEANDEIFRIVEGTMSVLVGERWIDAPAGSTLVVPAGTTHDFANRTDAPAALFNVFIPGGFEKNMPDIVRWYEENG
ncbi:cupin domain-containing protein [Mesorhizobium sp. KR9-304]|uniref:cupin domain-containing protein n=1 Tax=Mesorhizobium sp. KR9-304 TaxID=3156614 RepID=UPI0032B51805